MNMPDMPVNVPVDNPDADTEWNDILRSKGIIPEKPPSPTPQIQEALLEARRLAHENRLEGKDLDELDELEDDEDDDFLESYRQKRLGELNTIASKSIYGQVYPLQKPEYAAAVTEESSKAFVCVLLTSSLGNNTESTLASNMWTALAPKYGDIKFCQMRADLCIEGYPERNTPTILIYKDADIKKQVVTLRELGGVRAAFDDFEKMLISVGAIQHSDHRLRQNAPKADDEPELASRKLRSSDKRTGGDDDDSDWD